MTKSALIIFTRNPEPGKVKTRLAASIGNEKALEVYQKLLLHTRAVCQEVDVERFLFYDNQVVDNDIWSREFFTKLVQKGDDLGERMKNAFEEIFDKNYDKIIIVGSDLPELSNSIISEAFAKLENNDFVIGPAEDGGYYLLGMKQSFGSVFDINNWGTDTVFNDTMQKLIDNSVALLPMLNDIDTIEDLEKSPNFKNL